jgi:hypothetical protein
MAHYIFHKSPLLDPILSPIQSGFTVPQYIAVMLILMYSHVPSSFCHKQCNIFFPSLPLQQRIQRNKRGSGSLDGDISRGKLSNFLVYCTECYHGNVRVGIM